MLGLHPSDLEQIKQHTSDQCLIKVFFNILCAPANQGFRSSCKAFGACCWESQCQRCSHNLYGII